MKKYILVAFVIVFFSCDSKVDKTQKNKKLSLELINLTMQQIELMEELENTKRAELDSIFLDKLYQPNLELWNSYLGNDVDFLKWLHETSYPELDLYRKKAQEINLKELNHYFKQTSIDIEKLTGFEPKGKWYIVFGPKWTDAGGFGNGTMVLDLANSENNLAHIKLLFPHELNHQIYSNTVPATKNIVLKKILNEGFACYVSYLFHNKKIPIAKELQYSADEFKICKENDKKIIQLLNKHKNSDSKEIATLFTARNHKIREDLPGAIGYYMGFRIVEEYVKLNGENSWKDIYTMNPTDVLEKSGILKQVP